MHRPAVLAVTVILCGALLAAACGEDDDGSASATSAPSAGGGTATLVVKDFAFGEVQGARAGQPITIDNKDGFPHTVTADDDSFDVAVGASSKATLTVDRAGTYTIRCAIHPSMTGTLTVG